MNIKMKSKDSKNLKNKIGLKNLLVQKNSQSFKPKNINIQTINIEKYQNYFNKDKKFLSTKNLNKIRYLNNSSINYNINNINYIQNEEQISLFDSSGSDRVPSPINSLNSSSFFTNTIKKRKQKRHQKKNKNKFQYNSINNLSLNSNIDNSNNSIFLCSSSSSIDNDYSESSNESFKSRENRKKNYLEKMMVEENELDYLKRSEVGLISSEEEENNNSLDNSNSIEENFNNEIERILIEIYNKNISIISSGNYNEITKNSSEIEDIEKQIKKYLKRENLKTNLLVLKSLSNKIKELVGKYKEKVFEIEEIKNIYESIQLKRPQYIINNQIIHCNNSVGSNVATNSNSSIDSYNDEDNFFKNNLLVNVKDEIIGKGVTNVLLRELINIKNTLRISSKEIEAIFKYPLSILKNENGKRVKFSIELMQCEEFCKTLLNDDLISMLLSQIKNIFNQLKIPKITRLIEELEENCDHKNEMTRFIKYLNDKLGIKKSDNKNDDNKIEENNYLDEIKMKENLNNNIIDHQIGKESVLSLNNSTNSKEKIKYNSENAETSKKIKTKKKNNNINDNKDIEYNNNEDNNDGENNNNELNFKDIDELLNYINDEKDLKKGKKKGKRGKKNKKQNNNNNINEKVEDNIKIINSEKNDNDDNKLDDDFEKEFENFKRDIENNTFYIYDINKVTPILSKEFLTNISKN